MIKTSDELVKELSREFDLPEFVIREIVQSPFRFLKSIMEKKQFESLMLPYIGKFVVHKNIKKYMTKWLNEKSERDKQSSSKQSVEEG